MNNPWQSSMHLGIVHFMAFPETAAGERGILESALKVANDPFFDVIEITHVRDEGTRRELKQLLEAARVEVGFGAQPCLLSKKLSLASLEEDNRQAAVAEVRACIDEAYFYNARLLATLDGPKSDPGPAERERAKELLADSLRQLCRYAEDRAKDYVMAISLETFDRAVDKRCLIGPTSEAVRLAGMVRESCPNFGLTIDLSHLPLLGETAGEALQLAKDFLIHAHVGNAVARHPEHPAYGDMHPRFCLPEGENGVAELAGFLEVLVDIGYFAKKQPTRKPVVTFEVKPQLPGESPELIISHTKRVWHEAWSQVRNRPLGAEAL
ncbi:MAG: TIM barrel protein [Chloroflexi bacterium]|nr:TIM barrel protein [Chloroflexota bacterium]